MARADCRGSTEKSTATLQEVNDITLNAHPAIPYPHVLVARGDMNSVMWNMGLSADTPHSPNLPSFYAVVGNHDDEVPSDSDHVIHASESSLKDMVNAADRMTCSFHSEQIHCSVLDLYTSNSAGDADAHVRAWLRHDVAATTGEQVLLFGHEPALPRRGHEVNSPDTFPHRRTPSGTS